MRLLQNAEWVEANFGGCELGNIQRSRRLKIMASKMLECPEASLPQQNLEWSDLKAAYRLCDRKEVTFDAVAGCHWTQTRQTLPGRYLLISDTTDINHSPSDGIPTESCITLQPWDIGARPSKIPPFYGQHPK